MLNHKVHRRAFDERMHLGLIALIQQLHHEIQHTGRVCAAMQDLLHAVSVADNGHTAGAVLPGFAHQTLGHPAVRFEQVVGTPWIQLVDEFISVLL
ncbi:MAG: hypothetical protein LBR73_00015 [Oscillospiraceae bacterium]|nr:hypothetical protein [Oscillospiraceae bacterium]